MQIYSYVSETGWRGLTGRGHASPRCTTWARSLRGGQTTPARRPTELGQTDAEPPPWGFRRLLLRYHACVSNSLQKILMRVTRVCDELDAYRDKSPCVTPINAAMDADHS